MNVVVRLRPATRPDASSQGARDFALFGGGSDASSVLWQDELVTDHGDNESVSVVKESSSAPGSALTFKFGRVFSDDATTDSVYATTLRPIVCNVLKGVPGCVFAYGQTGSGKTHTITGTEGNPGLLPLAVDEILKRTAADSDVTSSCVYLTYLEVYNEVLRDLLSTAASAASMSIKEDKQGRPVVPEATRVPVSSLEEAQAVVARGESHRAKGANAMHEHASRSHAVFTITVETKRVDEPGSVRVGILHVVDLAGSETAVQSALAYPADADATEIVQRRKALGDIANAHLIERDLKKTTLRNREGSHIRKSLLALVTVVHKLAERSKFIPYRDSKLTRLLQPPLEGNSNTAIICTVNPAEGKESISTLRFAATAQRIHRTPAKTVALSTEGTMLRSFERQMSVLKLELCRSVEDERRRADELKVVSDFNMSELESANAERAALRARINDLNRSLFTSTNSRNSGPATPRRLAKELRCLDNPTKHRRSGSAPNRRRGAIVDEPTAPAPQWLRDGSTKALSAKNASLEHQLIAMVAERDAAVARAESAEAAVRDSHACVADLASALAALQRAAVDADAQREALDDAATKLHAALVQSRTQKKAKGFGCGGAGAAATRHEEPIVEVPATHRFADLIAHEGGVAAFDASSASLVTDARALLLA